MTCSCKKKCRFLHQWRVVVCRQKDVYSALAGYATGGSEGVWGTAWFAHKECLRCGRKKETRVR